MDRYDPLKPPDPEVWLALDEGRRMELVEAWHRAARVRLPNARIHAVMHTVVETQIAMQLPSVTGAMTRLQADGLDRHEALHAVASVMIGHIQHLLGNKPAAGDPNDKYYAGLDRLTADSWRRDFG